MEYEIKHCCRVKLDLLIARKSFLKEPKDVYEECLKKLNDHAYFIILNKIDGANEMKWCVIEKF